MPSANLRRARGSLTEAARSATKARLPNQGFFRYAVPASPIGGLLLGPSSGPFFISGGKSMSERCGVFVDAGYVLAAGADLLYGLSRRDISCDYPSLVDQLNTWAVEQADVPLLRTYWYDGAIGGSPTEDHHLIGRLKNVKVRLGRVTGGGQKGVDSRIVLDLILLAQNHAITTAYLVSGDEDLQEGVEAAQELGVRVVLVGLPESRRGKQSFSLICASDEHVVLDRAWWAGHFSQSELPTEEVIDISEADLDATVRTVAVEWLVSPDAEMLASILDNNGPPLPREVDGWLLSTVAARLQISLRDDEVRRRQVRNLFRSEIVASQPLSS